MIDMFSFIKHFMAYKIKAKEKKVSKSVQETLFQSVELWTIVSFGTGILFAIPQINLVIHGTYLVVIHAMGSMIGVQLMLVFVAGFSIFKPVNQESEYRIKLGIKLINSTLIFLWVVMGGIGLIKGIMRVDYNYYEVSSVMQNYMYFLPLLGIVLLVSISLISVELIRVCLNIKGRVKPKKIIRLLYSKIKN